MQHTLHTLQTVSLHEGERVLHAEIKEKESSFLKIIFHVDLSLLPSKRSQDCVPCATTFISNIIYFTFNHEELAVSEIEMIFYTSSIL